MICHVFEKTSHFSILYFIGILRPLSYFYLQYGYIIFCNIFCNSCEITMIISYISWSQQWEIFGHIFWKMAILTHICFELWFMIFQQLQIYNVLPQSKPYCGSLGIEKIMCRENHGEYYIWYWLSKSWTYSKTWSFGICPLCNNN